MMISTARGNVGVLLHGDGPAVVLLHPLALSAEVWRPLVETSPGLRFIGVDAPGHGATRWDGQPFTVEDMAEDAAGVLESLGVRQAGLVGLSMGGSTAVVLAARRPDLISSLILVDTTACYGDDRVDVWEQRANRASTVAREDQIPFQLDRWFSPGTLKRDPGTVQRVSEIFLGTDTRAHAAACRALGGFDGRALLEAIQAPTLVVVGSDDYATPPSMARELHAGIAGSRLHVLDGTRHLGVFDEPQAWCVVTDHLAATIGRNGAA